MSSVAPLKQRLNQGQNAGVQSTEVESCRVEHRAEIQLGQ